jgi:hypothetical protein
MRWTDSLIALPRFAQRPSGLLVPVESSRPAVSPDGNELGDGTLISPSAFFIMANPPSALEQMRIVIDEAGVGQPISTIEELREMVAALSFENAMLAISRLACHAWQIRGDTQAQLELVQTVFGDPDLVASISRLARREDRLEIFPEQHAAILQRLLVLHGRDAQLGEAHEGEQAIFNRAWLAAATPTAELDRDPPTGPDGRRHWITYLIQNGTYNRAEDSLSSMIRPQILLSDIAGGESARANPHFCEIDAWHREAFGIGLVDQFALGFAVAATAHIFDEETPIGERSVLDQDFLADLADKLGHDVERSRELLSAPRDWYCAEFEQREASIANIAWDRIPFEIRPLLRLSNGGFLVVSPRALESWLGDGFYHRTLAAARRRGQVERFQAFYGALVEEHVLRTLRHVYPNSGRLSSHRVFGEQPYGRGEGKRSPDVAVECGPDLVLFEVCSGRFTLRTVVEGSPDAALDDLARLIFDKAEQLDHRITEFLNGEWTLPGVDTSQVERIWPIVVSADVLQNEMLWDEIRDRLAGILNQPKVQRLTLLDLGELEQLAALAEQGHGLIELVSGKARSPYAELDFKRYVFDTPNLSDEVRLTLLDERWFAEVDRAAEAFGFDINSTEAIKAKNQTRESA